MFFLTVLEHLMFFKAVESFNLHAMVHGVFFSVSRASALLYLHLVVHTTLQLY